MTLNSAIRSCGWFPSTAAHRRRSPSRTTGSKARSSAPGNAWNLPEGTFLQAYGACGYRFLAKLDTVGGTPSKVSVPGYLLAVATSKVTRSATPAFSAVRRAHSMDSA